MQFYTENNNFEDAIKIILIHEGGFTDNPHDPGGKTNFGITQESLNECFEKLGLPSNVEDLIEDNAKIFYQSEYWDKYDYDKLSSSSIATKIFDMAVNMGAHEAHILAQRAVNNCGNNIKVDGIMGDNTINAINILCLHGRELTLKAVLVNQCKRFYENLVEEKPALKEFLNGWLARASWS